jgi:UPF0755 protein
VADQPERTAEEREAARLERERRRTGLDPSEPEPEAEDEQQPEQYQEPESDGEYEDAPDDGGYEDDGFEDDGYEDNGHEDDAAPEIASGTRRVRRGEHRRPIRTRKATPAKPQRKRRRWLVRSVALISLVVGVAALWFLYELFQPFHGSGHGRVTVAIPAHSTSSEVANLLVRDGVIDSSFFFELRATLAGERGDMRSGTYHLQLDMGYGSVLKILTTPPPPVPTTEITIIPGRTRHQIDSLLRSQGVKGSYFDQTRKTKLLNLKAYRVPRSTNSLEGFLFPDTFTLVKPVKIGTLVADQLADFKKQFATVNLSYARRHHMTPYDVLIIASLIEAEAANEHDRLYVSSVIYNRLAQNMELQLDSTTRYATGNYGKPLTVSQLKSSSPWNTHTHQGLPPTPIDNPGLAAIEAAAHPASSNYLFFFAKPCGGNEVFAAKYSQFLALANKYKSC